MRLPTLVELAKGEAHLDFYSDGKLRYILRWSEDGCASFYNFPFDVPVDDAGGGKFLPVMRGLTVLRWVRRELENLTEASR